MAYTSQTLSYCLFQEHRRVFGNAWLTFLKLKLPSKVYKRVLVLLHEKVMPHMSSPVLLTDFLTSSYNVGEFKTWKMQKDWRGMSGEREGSGVGEDGDKWEM